MVTNAKASAIKTAVVPEPEPIRDTQKLQKYCCGLNYAKEGSDPELKPDSEYPEWLWDVHTGPPKTYKDYDPNTREYWYALERAQEAHQEQIRGGKDFYVPPREQELNFYSRLPPKKTS